MSSETSKHAYAGPKEDPIVMGYTLPEAGFGWETEFRHIGRRLLDALFLDELERSSGRCPGDEGYIMYIYNGVGTDDISTPEETEEKVKSYLEELSSPPDTKKFRISKTGTITNVE